MKCSTHARAAEVYIDAKCACHTNNHNNRTCVCNSLEVGVVLKVGLPRRLHLALHQGAPVDVLEPRVGLNVFGPVGTAPEAVGDCLV